VGDLNAESPRLESPAARFRVVPGLSLLWNRAHFWGGGVEMECEWGSYRHLHKETMILGTKPARRGSIGRLWVAMRERGAKPTESG
jgi:hypothetical protein